MSETLEDITIPRVIEGDVIEGDIKQVIAVPEPDFIIICDGCSEECGAEPPLHTISSFGAHSYCGACHEKIRALFPGVRKKNTKDAKGTFERASGWR